MGYSPRPSKSVKTLLPEILLTSVKSVKSTQRYVGPVPPTFSSTQNLCEVKKMLRVLALVYFCTTQDVSEKIEIVG